MAEDSIYPAAVALVHGFPDGPMCWEAAARVLRGAGRLTYCPALPGYGGEPVAPNASGYTPMALAENVARQLMLTGRRPGAGMHIVGHDWGGITAWMMTRMGYETSSRILSLTIVGAPHPCMLQAHFQAGHSAYARALSQPWLPELWLRVRRYEPLIAPLRAAGMSVPMLDRLRVHCTDRDSLRAMLGPYRSLVNSKPIAPYLAGIPILLLRGEHDPYVAAQHMLPPNRHREDLRIETLHNMGHWPHLQAPDLLSKRLLTFWCEVESQA